MKKKIIAKKFKISGIVQGVGFRPFLFNLAHKYKLKGKVLNTSQGVTLIVQGISENIELFYNDIYKKKPVISFIANITSKNIPIKKYKNFVITKSLTKNNNKSALIPPDVSLCEDCINEIKDPKNRRYYYPFTNCTNCGPRYTIIKDIPYDRPKTSMNIFKMCLKCQKEYNNPENRRFHAQPNACSLCGPYIFLLDNKKNKIQIKGSNINQTIIAASAKFLKQGKIIAIKGLGGFHLSADAQNHNAVKKLRLTKKRPDKPFAIMVKSISCALKYVFINDHEKKLLTSYNKPIVLLRKKENLPKYVKALSPDIASNNKYLGIMLAYTPLHYLLFEQKNIQVLVMTSCNKTGEPIAINNDDAFNSFSHIADYFLFNNRDIYFRADDSIVQWQSTNTRFLRRSRGYAPLPIFLRKSFPKIIGCGAGLKNTICLTKNNKAFLSQHIGNLDNEKTFEFYKKNINHLKKILDIEPEIIVHDMHPEYMSTRYAKNQAKIKKIPIIAVQHHHSHAVSCMAENNLKDEVIAIVLDGTGFGTDNNIWGGEILVCNEKSFKRKAHLAYIKMPGGNSAIIEPWKMGASYLNAIFGNKFYDLDIPIVKKIKKQNLKFICQMIKKNINSPLTSSCGRLFDAVSSILGIRHKISFEGQGAMELESIAQNTGKTLYDFNLIEKKENQLINQNNNHTILEIDVLPCIKQIIEHILEKKSFSEISANFHKTVAACFIEAFMVVSKETNIKKAVLSGGVFNNRIILGQILTGLGKRGITVYTHTKIPFGDGGICLGQAVIAGAII